MGKQTLCPTDEESAETPHPSSENREAQQAVHPASEPSPFTQWDIEIRREQVQRTLGMQEDLLKFLMWTFGLSLGVTLPAFLVALFLTGWKGKTGFEVSDKVLIALAGTTIAEAAGLITTFITSLRLPKD